VHEAVADEFFALVKRFTKEFYGSDPEQTEWFGRCINDKAFERLNQLQAEHKPQAICGGRHNAATKYIEPTVFDFGSDLRKFSEATIMQDEIFGPLLPCARYSNLEDVIQFVRNLPTGKPLALYLYSTDQTVVKAVKTRTTSGGLCVNDNLMHLANHELPFGGVGRSGMGGYHGFRSFKSFSHEKAVLEKSPMLDNSPLLKPLLDCRFPPYSPTKIFLIKAFSRSIVEKLVNIPLPLIRKIGPWAAIAVAMWASGARITMSKM